MRASVFWWTLWLLISASTALQAAPIGEIRTVLRSQALVRPDEGWLASLTEANLDSALQEFDPYARYLSADDARLRAGHAVDWVGIGAELFSRDGQVLLSVYTGGPADRAGVPDRSRLQKIDGRRVSGMPLDAVAKLFRGREHTSVRLELITPAGKRRNAAVVRGAFRPLDVEASRTSRKRLLRIRRFLAGLTRPAVEASLEVLARSDAKSGASRQLPLIIDLRDCGGGDLYEALDLAGMFLKQGTPLGSLRGRTGSPQVFQARSGDKYTMPLMLLIGPDTASAAEIFAGILRQHGRARLAGQRSYGKCTSQTDRPLSDGSMLHFTNAEVLLPQGDTCTGLGLTPDLEVQGTDFDRLDDLAADVLNGFSH